MANIAYMAVSLDGYIADRHGTVDWLDDIPNPDDSDFGYNTFIERIDALLMGANSFRFVHSYGTWPYTRPVFVASKSMTELPEGYEKKAFLVRGEVTELLQGVRDRGYKNIYVDGGVITQDCLRAGVLDELIMTHIPIILGGGVPLFSEANESLHLDHVKTEVFNPAGLVQSHYLVRKESNS